MGHRDEDTQTLIAQARRAWVDMWMPIRWDYFVRLRWRTDWIGETTANDHLEQLSRALHRPHPMLRLVMGFHADPFPHAHGLVHCSRRHRVVFLNADEFREWLQGYWPHGRIWAEVYDPTKRHPEHGGALEYLARDPGSVVWG